MTSLSERARAAYAIDQQHRQWLYDRETERLIARFRQDVMAVCGAVLAVMPSAVAVTVEATQDGTVLAATARVDEMTFRLDRRRGDVGRPDLTSNPVLYVALPCTRCGDEYHAAVRSLRDLGRTLDAQYCVDCRGRALPIEVAS